jgi:hypothetical protein
MHSAIARVVVREGDSTARALELRCSCFRRFGRQLIAKLANGRDVISIVCEDFCWARIECLNDPARAASSVSDEIVQLRCLLTH